MSQGQVEDQILESKAIPDLRFKLMIFDDVKFLHDSKKLMQKNYSNYNTYQRQDVSEFKSCIGSLFDKIKNMMLVKIEESSKNSGVYNYDMSLYEKLLKLERGVNYPVPTLLELSNFLDRFLHKLNITNLLQKDIDPVKGLELEY